MPTCSPLHMIFGASDNMKKVLDVSYWKSNQGENLYLRLHNTHSLITEMM